MPSEKGKGIVEMYRLVQEGGSADQEWTLSITESALRLYFPDGGLAEVIPLVFIHPLFDLNELYTEGKISIATQQARVIFKKHRAAVAAVRRIVEESMIDAPRFCERLRRDSLRQIPIGLVLFIVCGGLFGLYCWYASWAPDPPKGHWIRWFGWAIHGGLLILLAGAIAGPLLAYHAFRQLLRLRRIRRLAIERDQQRQDTPDSDLEETEFE